ncbi:hypothetical protein CYLTODRAFT_416284 [Cylindrobasidium torrendii FP15055 ss-10]|uniref:Protein CASP n=1 Tax=Cylindrobasidium torrendii FP15055 ss-10 TaxID=1314674 RepID=A0A0D7BXR6_9AGAR|nr:hypothetical protein CYLTODRAFT_416284 [Cylindrobasidium torrendii FP15055 ss-10]
MATNFSGALSTWRNVNLSELQKSLDTQGVEIIDNQKANLVGRKTLSDKTKEFKRIPDEDKVSGFKGLLKAYQSEIDSLTKRSRTAENAFLDLYKVLAEAPDPYPLLEAAVDQAIKVEEAKETDSQLQKLREENAELKKKLADTASLEAAKTKLAQVEAKMESMTNERVAQKEAELHATYDEKLRNYEEREQDLQRQLAVTKSQLRDLRTSNETAQSKLVDHSSKQDQEVVAKLAEVDMMVADLERANGRVATVERRNEILRAEIESIRSGNDDVGNSKALQARVEEYEVEVERMSNVLEAQKATLASAEQQTKKLKDDMARDAQKKVDEIQSLKQRLQKYHDYDEIKRELGIMKYVEFAGFDDDFDHDVHLPNPNPEKEEEVKSLEALLALKNKKLLEELTKIRILHGELGSSLDAARESADAKEAELKKQKMLNEKLETDLMSAGTGNATPTTDSKDIELDVLADLGKPKESGDGGSSSVRTTPIPFAPSADTSILPIVKSQRDRFRQRNAELEEELRKQFQIISDLRAEVKTLQADNLKLYEKVRYMQSYREGRVTTQLDPLPAPLGGPSDDMGKYRTQYEEAMNPFEQFKGREAARAYQSLNPIERGVLVATKAILNNRRTRAVFLCYALALHVLVMFTTYECATQEVPLQRQPRI